MTSTAPLIDFAEAKYKAEKQAKITEYAQLRQRVTETYHALQTAWIVHVEAVLALRNSNTWKRYAPTWKEYCKSYLPYSASTYRVYKQSIPIAELVESVTNESLSESESRKIKDNIREVVENEDAQLIPSVWQLAYEYSKNIAPAKNVLSAAYEILKQERDNNTLSVNGESFDIKALGQKAAIKEALFENIQAHKPHSKRAKVKGKETLLALWTEIVTKDSISPGDKAHNFRIIWDE